MIVKSEVMNLLLKACPSYENRWKEYIKDFYSNGEEQLLYADMGDFASHLVELYKRNQLDEFDQVFYVIERLHVEGDDFVKEAATIGLLEAIQNIASDSNPDPECFVKFLRPVSLKWWKHLNDFWSGNWYEGKEKE